MLMSDQIDLLVEQVKMLAGEIAFSTSTLKRLMEQSTNDPEGSRTQVYFTSMSIIHRTFAGKPNLLIIDSKYCGYAWIHFVRSFMTIVGFARQLL